MKTKSPFILPLSGNAVNAVTFFPPIVDFGLQTYPAVATRNFEMQNHQSVPVTVTQISNSDPEYQRQCLPPASALTQVV